MQKGYIVGEKSIERDSGDQQKEDRDAMSDFKQKQTKTRRSTERPTATDKDGHKQAGIDGERQRQTETNTDTHIDTQTQTGTRTHQTRIDPSLDQLGTESHTCKTKQDLEQKESSTKYSSEI